MRVFFSGLLVFLCSLCITSLGQDLYMLDSIRSKIPYADLDVRSLLYETLAWEFRKSHPDSTIFYANKSIELINKEGLGRNRAQALNFIGVGHHYLGDNVKAFEMFLNAKDEGLAVGDSVQYGHALNNLGRIYLNQGDFLKAYDDFHNALEVFKNIGDEEGEAYAYKSLAELYQTQNNTSKALEMSEKTLKIRSRVKDIDGQISIMAELARIYENLENYDKAFDYYLQAKVKAESVNDAIGIARINLGISQLYYKQRKKAEALIYGQKALRTAETSRNRDLTNQIRLQLSKVLLSNQESIAAKEHLLRVVANSDITMQLPLEKEAYLHLSEISKTEGDVELAFQYFTKYAELNAAWSDAEAARKIERYESRLEIEKKERENEVLRLNQARNKAVIERQKFEKIALIAITGVIGVLMISIWYLGRKRKQVNLKLQHKNEQIAQQANEINKQNAQINIQNGKLKKRNDQLAELNSEKDTLMNIVAHDLKSPLNRIKGITELMGMTKLDGEQRNLVGLLKQISDGSIRLIGDLLDVNAFEGEARKTHIHAVDVHDMLLKKAKSFDTEAKTKDIIICTVGEDSKILVDTDDSYLSRILDNLISNAIKFSGKGKKVMLSALREDDHVLVKVKDEGPGFTEEDKKCLYQKFKKLSAQPTAGETSNGLGLAIVKNLVDRIGGEVSLLSSPGEGREFTIKLFIGQNQPILA